MLELRIITLTRVYQHDICPHIQYRDPAHDSMSCHVTQVDNMTQVAQACGGKTTSA